MFPAENPLAYGESAPGMQLMIILFKIFGLPDYWVNYLFILTILSLTAFGIFIFSSNFTRFFPAQLFAGFCFSCSNMIFAHIDDSVIIFYFIPALALHQICRYFAENKNKHLIFSSILAGLEIYFSFYVFFYQFLMIFILFFWSAKKNGLKTGVSIKLFSLYILTAFIVAAPNFFYYLHTLYGLDFDAVINVFYTTKMLSFNLVNMLLVLPDNLIYPNLGELAGRTMTWGLVQHYNFIGLLALALFGYSMFKWNSKNRILFALLAVTSVFFACGPVFMFNFKEVFYSPLYIFYKPIPVLKFIRVPVRAYFIFLFAVSVSAALSFEKICQKTQKQHLVIIAFFVIQILENVPFPIKGFDAAITEKVPEIYETVKQQNIRQPLILELPAEMSVKFDAEEMKKFKKPKDFIHKNKSGENTRLSVSDTGIFTDSWDDIFQYNREVIYTNWQNSHKIDSVNGLNGYFPTPRIIFQYYINTLPDPESFTLLRKSGINFIVWHEFMKTRTDTLSLDDLEKSPCLIKIAENSEGSTLFKLISCDTKFFYEKNRKQ